MSVTFFTAYVLFLSPVILALVREWQDENHPETTRLAQSLLGFPLLRSLVVWIAFLVSCYAMMSRLPKLKRKTKTHAMHVDDIMRLVFFGSALFTIGGVGDRIESGMVNKETGLSFIPLTLYFTLFFTLLFELIKHENVTLSKDLLSNKMALIITLIGATTLVGVLVSLFRRASHVSEDFFHTFAGLFAIGFVVHIAGFFLAPLMRDCHVHIHHYYWPIPFMFMCVFHNDVAMIAQAIFVGVHIHGVNCFGVEPLFYDHADHDKLKMPAKPKKNGKESYSTSDTNGVENKVH